MSPYLSALTAISDTDYVGNYTSIASLNAPYESTVHLLTKCDEFAEGHPECLNPRYAYYPDITRGLDRPNGTPLPGFVPGPLFDAMESWSSKGRFITGAYIAATIMSLLVPIEAFFAPLFACITGAITTILLFAATATATVVFKKIRDSFNEFYGMYGTITFLGAYPIAAGFIAAVLTLVATILYTINYRHSKLDPRARMSDNTKPGGGSHLAGDSAYQGAAGLFHRGPNHKYVQIDEQQHAHALHPQAQSTGVSTRGAYSDYQDSGALGTERRSNSLDDLRHERRLDEDWAAPDEYHSSVGAAGGKTSSGPGASIPMMSLGGGGNKKARDLNEGYEPFSEGR